MKHLKTIIVGSLVLTSLICSFTVKASTQVAMARVVTNIEVDPAIKRQYVVALHTHGTVNPLAANTELGSGNFNPWNILTAGAYDESQNPYPLPYPRDSQNYCLSNQVIQPGETLLITGRIDMVNGEEIDNLQCQILR
jgi:hypothetical protein